MAKKPKIVLYQSQQVNQDLGQQTSYDILPLEMLQVAAIPDAEGYEVVVLDASLHSNAEAHERALEACEGAIIFGTTAILGYMVTDGHLAAQKVRERFPEIKIIAGGWFPSCMPEEYLQTGIYDAVCMGQGELTLMDFIRAVEAGEPLSSVAGLALWHDNHVVYTDHRAVVGWNTLKRAAWHLIDIEPYKERQLHPSSRKARNHMPSPPSLGAGNPYFGISYFSSFGCPEPCTFCCSPEVTAQRWKAIPPDMMVDDLADLRERWGFDVVRFQDANFGVAEKRLRGFSKAMLERDVRFDWSATMEVHSIRRYKPDTLDDAKAAGLYLSCVGAESADMDTVARIKKQIGVGHTKEAAYELHKRGIITSLTYIIGFPDEPEHSMLATLDEARDILSTYPSVSAHVYPFRPIPGNELYREALEIGYEPPKTLVDWGNMLELHVMDTWQGNIPRSVERRWRLYYQYASFFHGLVRKRRGLIERMAEWRIRSGNYTLPLELKAYYALDRILGRKAHKEDDDQTWVMSREDEGVAMVN